MVKKSWSKNRPEICTIFWRVETHRAAAGLSFGDFSIALAGQLALWHSTRQGVLRGSTQPRSGRRDRSASSWYCPAPRPGRLGGGARVRVHSTKFAQNHGLFLF